MSSDLSQQQVDYISNAIADGEKIAAIKHYKDATGCGLREAKDFVEGLTERLIAEDPERYEKAARVVKVNPVIAIIVLLLILGAFLGFLLGT